MTHLDPAYCADGCGRLAETERAYGDGSGGLHVELVCASCLGASYDRWTTELVNPHLKPSDHATLEDR